MVKYTPNTPLVSCVTCFLNAEKFVEEAVESVLAQTYDNWELLLVDDGSFDGSTEIALHYAKKYHGKIIYLEHEGHRNLGLSISRNLGIFHSRGSYIAFLDADDIWLPQKLEKQVAILEAQPEAGMVFGLHNRWFSWTGRNEDASRDQEFSAFWDSDIELDTLVWPPKLFTQYLQDKVGTPLTCGVLLRRTVIEEIGDFDQSVSYLNEDGPFFAKLYLKIPIFVESGCWDRYRQHPDSIVHIARAAGQWFDDRTVQPVHLAEMTILEEYLVKQGITDSEIWKMMNAQLFPYRHPSLYALQQTPKRMKKLVQSILWRAKLVVWRAL